MSDLFQKFSHLQRYKVQHGIGVVCPTTTDQYICEMKLKKIIRERVDDNVWRGIRSNRKYKPPWMSCRETFVAKLLRYVEKDQQPKTSLEYFYKNGICNLVDKYVNKRKNANT
jgi:hypothetical protein